jgi:hypothetical protein
MATQTISPATHSRSTTGVTRFAWAVVAYNGDGLGQRLRRPLAAVQRLSDATLAHGCIGD